MSIMNLATTIFGRNGSNELPVVVDTAGRLEVATPTGTTGPAKAEDSVAVSTDLGMAVFGVRAPATPVAPTSAAGDYGWVLLDDEGKIINSNQANSSQTKRSRTDLTAVTDLQLLASAGATLRNYITDITIENTGAAAARFLLRDATTTVWSCTVPAGSTLHCTFSTPIRPAAVNTVWNGQLGAAGTVTVSLVGYAGI